MSKKYTERINVYFTKRQMDNLKALTERESTMLSTLIRNLAIKGLKEKMGE